MIRLFLSKPLCVASQEGLENFIELLQISMYNASLRCLEMLFSAAKRSKNSFDLHDESCARIQGFADCSEVNSKMSCKTVFEWCL
jgi:hypothetical protein